MRSFRSKLLENSSLINDKVKIKSSQDNLTSARSCCLGRDNRAGHSVLQSPANHTYYTLEPEGKGSWPL